MLLCTVTGLFLSARVVFDRRRRPPPPRSYWGSVTVAVFDFRTAICLRCFGSRPTTPRRINRSPGVLRDASRLAYRGSHTRRSWGLFGRRRRRQPSQLSNAPRWKTSRCAALRLDAPRKTLSTNDDLTTLHSLYFLIFNSLGSMCVY